MIVSAKEAKENKNLLMVQVNIYVYTYKQSMIISNYRNLR